MLFFVFSDDSNDKCFCKYVILIVGVVFMNDLIIRPLTKDDVAGAAEIKVNGWKMKVKNFSC